ncbi:MAG TPA: AsmA-like C-terminal region-containing protein [Ferruginibacter sp.]|nr:AsmA-like C-terminal region-containing protein [Ferruginibacter sp.]
MKKFLKIVGIIILLLLAFAFAAPFIFKGKIISFVKTEINDHINAKVNFSDVDISLFTHFPKLSVGIDSLQVIGVGAFESDTLMSANSINTTVNIMSLITGPTKIYSIDIESPRIHAIVNKDGSANWNITKDTTTSPADTAAAKPFKLQLNHYAIHNAYISYVDKQGNMSSELVNLNHEGSGDFSSDSFTLQTATTADEFTFVYGGIPFLLKVKSVANLNIQINNKEGIYSFSTDQISVNDLKVSGNGTITNLNGKGYDMDIKFNSPSTDFKSFLSLVPAIYKHDFATIKTSGTAAFDGYVKGIYSDRSIPGYHLNMAINNGFFQYPDLPKAVKNINVKAKIDDIDGQPDNNIIDVSQAHVEMDTDPFDFRILIKKPMSDMYIDAAAKGKLDFSQVAEFVKLAQGTSISGVMNADVYAKGNVSDLEKKQYDRFTAGGTISVTGFDYVTPDYPTGIKINNLVTSFTPSKIDITTVNGQYISTNFSGNGQINNMLNYVLQNKPLNATINVSADNVNLNELMGTTTDTTTKPVAATTPASAPFVVPANLDITLNAKVGKLHYDNLDISNLTGSTTISDETASIKNIKGNALDGAITINGSYSTKDSKTNPAIAFDYDVQAVDIQKTFATFNTVKKIMPIAQFITGKVTSQISMHGFIGQNMMPDVNTLSGKGNLLLQQASLSNFGPLDKIATTLNINSLHQIPLQNVKVFFEFTNGKLTVDPFAVKMDGIDTKVAGTQGFDQSMDYGINMEVPRAMMGSGANELVNSLINEVNASGVSVQAPDSINVKLRLGGTFASPTIKTDYGPGSSATGGLEDQAKAMAKAQIDSVKKQSEATIKDTIEVVKKEAVTEAKKELINQLSGTKDTTKPANNVEKSAKGLMNSLFK